MTKKKEVKVDVTKLRPGQAIPCDDPKDVVLDEPESQPPERNLKIVNKGIISEEKLKEMLTFGHWLPLFKTQIEDAKGEQYLAIIEQNIETKDIRTVRI
jgi:hypothetical protein